MVDTIKFLPPILKAMPSDIHHIKNSSPSKKITLPILFSTATVNYQNDRKTNTNYNKKSARRHNNNQSRQTFVSDSSDSKYRKGIDQEMTRYYPGTTIDMTASIKIKIKQQQPQQYKNSDREPFKTIIGNGTTVSSTSVLTNVDARSSRLFDTLSKHFTIRAEPLRPSNQFVNNTTSTLSSWKKYWTSSGLPKQSNEFYESDYIWYDSQCDPTLLSTKDYVTLNEASLITNSRTHRRNSSTSSTKSNSSTAIHISSPIIVDKQTLPVNDENQHCLPQTILSNEESSLMDQSKLIKEKRLSTTSSNTVLNSDDNEIVDRINRITTKIYKFPLPSNKPKSSKSISKYDLLKPLETSSRPTTKSAEKKETMRSSSNLFILKRKRQKTAERKSSNKSNRTTTTTKKHQFISTVTPTVLNSKYDRANWDRPYVTTRNDPPTPPCSPSSALNIEDNVPADNDTFDEQESTNNLTE